MGIHIASLYNVKIRIFRYTMLRAMTLWLAGSTCADRMKRALQIVGDRPLAEVAKDNPEDALRVYIIRNSKPYNDESPVCRAFPEESPL